ncbi:hypothetical protein [Micromonospora sp. L32]|uniref:hypothetical protein n=1 Tax=Micromonospora sp. L32 TaxID=3452214 RepID=UPI003F8B2D8F
MSIKTQTCYTVHCDGISGDGKPCDATIDHDYTPHYPDPEYAREEARDGFEWWCRDGVDLCDSCKLSPHEFVPEPPAGDWCCARCGLDADEHEPVLAPTP